MKCYVYIPCLSSNGIDCCCCLGIFFINSSIFRFKFSPFSLNFCTSIFKESFPILLIASTSIAAPSGSGMLVEEVVDISKPLHAIPFDKDAAKSPPDIPVIKATSSNSLLLSPLLSLSFFSSILLIYWIKPLSATVLPSFEYQRLSI